ncbi:hypothetical protein Y032_0049g1875 [Ancylostoma ceylanicum]|uniref:Uncharacterized protein n=1 Tax=Ancylostoma ceylanicum TaxID=53326 RepID=A0A016UBI0_9BILA|nr:hypothetical protein Y032_0049g1875 [Ancylostoma ceylanicum]
MHMKTARYGGQRTEDDARHLSEITHRRRRRRRRRCSRDRRSRSSYRCLTPCSRGRPCAKPVMIVEKAKISVAGEQQLIVQKFRRQDEVWIGVGLVR